tara:strand:- start:365 stop:1282 length:918 start_codon:yes stop_codon:yes gene_type:complete
MNHTPQGKSMMGSQANSRLRSAPSFGFGTEERSKVGGGKQFVSKESAKDKFGTMSPGPIYYPASSSLGYPSSPSHSFGASHRYTMSTRTTNASPGPGTYAMATSVGAQRDSQRHSYSSWGFGTSTRADQAKVFVSSRHAKGVTENIDSPGPGAYPHGGSMSRQNDSRKHSSQGYGMGTNERFFYAKESLKEARNGAPGPGAYNLVGASGKQALSSKTSYPISSFTKADRDRTARAVYLGPKQQSAFWGRGSPGPAVYGAPNSVGMQVSSVRKSAPRCGFGTAERFGYMDNALKAMATPGPGTYSI